MKVEVVDGDLLFSLRDQKVRVTKSSQDDLMEAFELVEKSWDQPPAAQSSIVCLVDELDMDYGPYPDRVFLSSNADEDRPGTISLQWEKFQQLVEDVKKAWDLV